MIHIPSLYIKMWNYPVFHEKPGGFLKWITSMNREREIANEIRSFNCYAKGNVTMKSMLTKLVTRVVNQSICLKNSIEHIIYATPIIIFSQPGAELLLWGSKPNRLIQMKAQKHRYCSPWKSLFTAHQWRVHQHCLSTGHTISLNRSNPLKHA